MNELEFLQMIRRERHIGYGRMMQIIANEWEQSQPGRGLVAEIGTSATEGDRRAFYACRAADPLAKAAGWTTPTEAPK
jgi:hypothetical protein